MADEPIQKGKNMADHFVETIEMVAIGSGALGRQMSYPTLSLRLSSHFHVLELEKRECVACFGVFLWKTDKVAIKVVLLFIRTYFL